MGQQTFFNNQNKLTPSSEIFMTNADGHGSSGTKVRTWSVTVTSTGSDITYTRDTTNGDKFTINTDGIYSVSYFDRYSAAAAFIGVTKNSNSLTSSIRPNGSAITRSAVMGWTTIASNATQGLTVIFRAVPGDIIRTQDDGTPDQNDTDQYVRITKIE